LSVLEYSSAQFKYKARGAAYGYGYNLNLSAPLNQPPFNTSKISRLNEMALLADSAQVNTFSSAGSLDNPMLEEFYYVDESNQRLISGTGTGECPFLRRPCRQRKTDGRFD